MKHWILSLAACATLLGCGGKETFTEEKQTEQVQMSINKVVGAWIDNAGTNGFEFHAAPTKFALLDEDIVVREQNYQKEGIRYINSEPRYYFLWGVNAQGDIVMEKKDPACQLRPLTFCPTIARERLRLTSGSFENAKFEFSIDLDMDGIFEDYEDHHLRRKKLIDFPITDKGYMLGTGHYRARSQYSISNVDGRVSITLPHFSNDHTLEEVSRNDYYIELAFPPGEKTEQLEFAVFGEENNMFVDVVFSYEHIMIYPTFDDSFVLTQVINRKLNPGPEVPLDRLEADEFSQKINDGLRFNVYGNIIDVPDLVMGQRYSTMMLDIFDQDELSGQAGNEITFHDNGKAYVTFPDLLYELTDAQKTIEFDWHVSDDRKTLWLENATNRVNIEFLSDDGDRYKYVYSNYNKAEQDFDVSNDFETLFTKNIDVNMHDLAPGYFEFHSPNSVMVYPVTLDENGDTEVDGIGEVEGGRWIIDENGDLIRYECFSLSGVRIDDYQRCVDSFEFVGTENSYTTYSHISRLEFLHKVSEGFYLVKYDALFWGGRFDFVEDKGRLGTYYLYKHIPK